jgi:hypothetical protein
MPYKLKKTEEFSEYLSLAKDNFQDATFGLSQKFLLKKKIGAPKIP